MRRGYSLLISILTFCMIHANGQSLSDLKFQLPPLVDRYKMDFEIVGLDMVTEEMLENLNLDQYEELRMPDADVEVHDIATGFDLIIYGVDKAIKKYNSGLKPRGSG